MEPVSWYPRRRGGKPRGFVSLFIHPSWRPHADYASCAPPPIVLSLAFQILSMAHQPSSLMFCRLSHPTQHPSSHHFHPSCVCPSNNKPVYIGSHLLLPNFSTFRNSFVFFASQVSVLHLIHVQQRIYLFYFELFPIFGYFFHIQLTCIDYNVISWWRSEIISNRISQSDSKKMNKWSRNQLQDKWSLPGCLCAAILFYWPFKLLPHPYQYIHLTSWGNGRLTKVVPTKMEVGLTEKTCTEMTRSMNYKIKW
jgi:hypothetical protein